MTRRLFCAVPSILILASCSSPKKLVIGSKTGTEQTLLAEIAAQHLERRLGTPVDRRLAIGDTIITHQALVSGQIDLYPEYTGIISTVIRKETPNPDPAILLERTRGEMARLAQAEFIGPLGFDAHESGVVDVADAAKIETLSDAAKGKTQWKVGVTAEFQQRSDGISQFSRYQLPMGAAVRAMEPRLLFGALEKRELTMVVTGASDGHLTLPKWKLLKDDQALFPPQQAVLLARTEALDRDPRIRAALIELAGKFPMATMRRLNAEVDIEKKAVAAVAADFLASARLK